MRWSQRNSRSLHAWTHNFFLFFAPYDSPANKFTPWFCVVLAGHWLGSLIHIHCNRWVLRILNCLLMSEDVSSGWGPILFMKERNSTSKVSTTVEKQSLNFVQKATVGASKYGPREWTRGLAVRLETIWPSPHLETGQ